MEELTIEEKAKAYDKALVIARSRYSIETEESVRICLELMFPKLKESEDEKIRKGLIQYFSTFSLDTFAGLAPKKIIAWLEKQGDQKSKFRVGDTIKCKYDDRQFTIKSVDLDKGTYTYTQEGCGNDIDYADEEFELVEQNPAWSEEDEKIRNWLVDELQRAGHPQRYYDAVKWLKSLKDRIKEGVKP